MKKKLYKCIDIFNIILLSFIALYFPYHLGNSLTIAFDLYIFQNIFLEIIANYFLGLFLYVIIAYLLFIIFDFYYRKNL